MSTKHAVPYRGAVFRYCKSYRDPCDPTGSWFEGGRFNHPGTYAIYLCSTTTCVDAEYRRYLAKMAFDAKRQCVRHKVPAMSIYMGEANLACVLDLTSAETRDVIGISREALLSDNRSLCQEKGMEAHEIGYEAIVSRSAAQQGLPFEERDKTIVVFPENQIGALTLDEVVATILPTTVG